MYPRAKALTCKRRVRPSVLHFGVADTEFSGLTPVNRTRLSSEFSCMRMTAGRSGVASAVFPMLQVALRDFFAGIRYAN